LKNKRCQIVTTILYVLLMSMGFLALAFAELLPSQELLISMIVLILTASYLYANRKRKRHD